MKRDDRFFRKAEDLPGKDEVPGGGDRDGLCYPFDEAQDESL